MIEINIRFAQSLGGMLLLKSKKLNASFDMPKQKAEEDVLYVID